MIIEPIFDSTPWWLRGEFKNFEFEILKNLELGVSTRAPVGSGGSGVTGIGSAARPVISPIDFIDLPTMPGFYFDQIKKFRVREFS